VREQAWNKLMAMLEQADGNASRFHLFFSTLEN